MELLEIEQRWLSLSEGYNKAEVTDHDFLHAAATLESELQTISGPAAEELLYRIQLKKLSTPSDAGITFCANNLQRLHAQHLSDPQRFPANPDGAAPGEELPNYFERIAPHAAMHAALTPQVSRERIEKLMDFAADFVGSDEDEQLMRAHVAQAMDDPRPLLTWLEEHPLPAAEEARSAGDWLQAYDHAAMAKLQLGYLHGANELVQAMIDSGLSTGNQPVALVAESLCPLATTVPLETSVHRARMVLTQAMGNDATVGFLLKVAEFLILGGLEEEGIALLEQAGHHPEGRECMFSLARAMRAAKEAGFGDLQLPRFAAAGWQKHFGRQVLTVVEIHAAADALARADAQAMDRRNGSDYSVTTLDARYPVLPLQRQWFEGTFVATAVLTPGSLVAVHEGTEVDPRVDIFLDGFGDVVDESAPKRMEEAGGLPEAEPFIKAMEAFYELSQDDPVRNEMLGEKILAQYGELLVAEDELGAQLIGLYMLHQYAGMPYEALVQGLDYLPLLAYLRPRQAIEVALYVYLNLRYRLGGPVDVALEPLLVATSLVADGHRAGPDTIALANALDLSGRSIDALAVCAASTESLRNHGGEHADPVQDRAAIHEVSANAFAHLGAFFEAAVEHATVSQLWLDGGNRPDALYAGAEAAHEFMEVRQPGDASRVLRSLEVTDSDPLSRVALVRGAQMRLVCFVVGEQAQQAWEKYFGDFKAAMGAWLEDFDEDTVGDYEDLINRLGHTSAELRSYGCGAFAAELMGWMVSATAGLPDPALRFKLFDDYAITLIYADKHDQAALVYESLAQQAQRAGNDTWFDNALARLGLGAEQAWHPAYAEALEALKG